jgi:oligosaccharide repeat unit polymerase
MHSNIPLGYGENMLRFLFVILNKLGFNIRPVLLRQEFVAVPLLTNVYTIYQPYYGDFSIFGALLIQFFLGLWHGFIYLKARLNKPLYIILYALFLYPLFMQFFQDQYFNLLSTWIQCFIVLFLYFFISNPQGSRGAVDGKPGYHHRELECGHAAL